jgi:uncharacterized protein (TIRG00374 family)
MKWKLPNLKLVFKTIISLGLVILLLINVDLSQIWQRLQALSYLFVIFALAYYTFCQWLSCLRWQIILKSNDHLVPMRTLLSSYFGGMFLNTFLPGTLGGDIYRVYRVARKTQDMELAFVSVFLERVTGLFALLALALLSIPLAFRLVGRWDIILLVIICTAMLSGVVFLIASPRLLIWAEPWLEKLRIGGLAKRAAKLQILLIKFARHRNALAWSMGLSLVFQLLTVFYYYMIAQHLKIPISYFNLLVFSAIVTAITLLPISLGGLGVKEALLAYLFNRVGLTIEQAISLSLTVTALAWLLSLPGGLVLLGDRAGFQEARRN